jgi:hypothetical protein
MFEGDFALAEMCGENPAALDIRGLSHNTYLRNYLHNYLHFLFDLDGNLCIQVPL